MRANFLRRGLQEHCVPVATLWQFKFAGARNAELRTKTETNEPNQTSARAKTKRPDHTPGRQIDLAPRGVDRRTGIRRFRDLELLHRTGLRVDARVSSAARRFC